MNSRPVDYATPASPESAPEDLPIVLGREIPLITTVCAAIFSIVFLVFYIQINHRIGQGHSGDFRHFYYAAKAMVDGTDLYTSGTGGYLYPPLIAMLYTPVARLDFLTAQRVGLTINLLLIVTGILLVSREFIRRFAIPYTTTAIMAVGLLGTLLNIDKVHGELQMFQTNALMFFCFALSLSLLDEFPILAGIPLGLIFNIKYLSLAMLPWLLIRRRYKSAGSFAVAIVAFALLPAVVTGWHKNLSDLSVAYGGLFHMVGVNKPGTEQANVEDIKDLLSCSITSAMARTTRYGVPMNAAMALAALIALCCAAVAVWTYVRNKIPVFLWPPAGFQRLSPFRSVLGLEFVAIVAATLCFSPQTNTRHLSMMLLMTLPSAALILFPRPGVPRWPVVFGSLVFFVGLIFPPGDRFSNSHRISLLWFGVGGQCWCILISLYTLLNVGLLQAKSAAE